MNRQQVFNRTDILEDDIGKDVERFEGSHDPGETYPVLYMSNEDFADFGSPEVITVTIFPGDLLNS